MCGSQCRTQPNKTEGRAKPTKGVLARTRISADFHVGRDLRSIATTPWGCSLQVPCSARPIAALGSKAGVNLLHALFECCLGRGLVRGKFLLRHRKRFLWDGRVCFSDTCQSLVSVRLWWGVDIQRGLQRRIGSVAVDVAGIQYIQSAQSCG